MRRTLVVGVAAAVSFVNAPAEAQGRQVESLRWLAACWESASPTRRIVERWQLSSAELKGDSRTIAGTREGEGERLRIYAIGDTLVYDAQPSAQARTEFKAVGSKGDSVVFANPAHDFPQRIVYRKVGADSLMARIEGDRAGRRPPTTYSYRRIDCATVTDAPSDAVEATLRANYGELGTMLDATVAGLNQWFAKFGGPDITYVFWATAGYRPPTVTREQIDRLAAQQSANTTPSTLTERTNVIGVERVLVRGDTAEVFATVTMAYKFIDAQGRYGTANERRARKAEQRRLDRWIKRDGKWTLSNASLIGEDVFVEGKLIQRNGRPLDEKMP